MLNCATCGKGFEDRDAARPRPGDTVMCYRCGGINRYKDDMTLRALTDEELRTFVRGLPGDLRAQFFALRAVIGRQKLRSMP